MIVQEFKSNNKTISTLECKDTKPLRRCGNTTRQANFAIDKLFEGYTVLVEDHTMKNNDDEHILNNSNRNLLRMITKRFNDEHYFKSNLLLSTTIVEKSIQVIRIKLI